MPKKEQDANTQAAEMVRHVTGTRNPRASVLLGNPETIRRLEAFKAADRERQRRK
jgi:hypothetical protein